MSSVDQEGQTPAHAKAQSAGSRSAASIVADDESLAVRVLSAAPDFFDRHPDVLASLHVTHPQSGDAVSLIERQVDVLRDQVSELETKFQDMVATARDNELLQDRMHALMVALAEVGNRASDTEIARQHTCDAIKRAFDIEYVTLKSFSEKSFSDGDASERGEAQRPQQAEDQPNAHAKGEDAGDRERGHELAKARLAHGRCLCDDKMPEALLSYLFGDNADAVNSCALLPLKRDDDTFAMAALGAADSERFSPDRGTLYLDRLATMLSVVVRF